MTPATSEYSILVVDDDADIVLGLQDLLEHDGYRVDAVGTCRDAIARGTSQHYNAVLLDLGLPDGDGQAVLKTLKEHDDKLPVIILTAFTTTERTVGSLTRGAFAYLTKPYNREELRATLQRAIGVQALAVKAERVEHALTESEERFQSLVESATDAILLADQDGHILSLNKAAFSLFGYTAQEAIGRPLTMIMPERYRALHERGLRRLRETGHSRLIGSLVELEGLRKDGTEFPLELSLATWNTSSGAYFSGIIRDITERRRAEEILDRLRRQHALILSQAGEGIYGLDLQGRATFVNPAAVRLLGYDAEELSGQNVHHRFHHSHPDGRPYPLEQCPIQAALRDGRVHRVDNEVFWKKDGTSLPVEYISTPIREGEDVTGAVVVFRDITERREAERALHESEERFRQLAEHIRQVVWMTDPSKNQMLYVSPAYEEIWGHSRASLYASPRSWVEAIHHEDRARVLDAALHKQALGTYDEEYRIVRPDGSLRWIRDRAFPIRDQTGSVYRIAGLAEDITDKKQAEDLLRTSRERLEFVIRGSSDGFWDGHVLPDEPWYSPQTPIWWSPRFKELLGFTDEEFPNVLESWASRLHPEEKEQMFAALRAHIEQRQPYDVEYRLLTKEGVYRWFRGRGQAVWDKQGHPLRMAGSLQCITDRKEAEESLRRSEELLRSIVNNTTAVIYVKYVDGRYRLINRRFEELFNVTQAQLQGKTDHDIFPRDIADAFRANDLKVIEAGRALESEEYAPHPNGLHPYISIKFPLVDHTGATYATCGISTDITERKRMENELRLSEERLRLALASAKVGIWDWDIRTSRMYWSAGVESIFGLSPGTFAGTYVAFIDLIHVEDRGQVLETLQRAIDSGNEVEFVHRTIRPDGTLHWLAWSGQVLRDQQDTATRVLGTVTERAPHRG